MHDWIGCAGTDAAVDALDKGLTFSDSQAAWLAHHIGNALVVLCIPTPERLDTMRARLQRLCAAATALRTEEGRQSLARLLAAEKQANTCTGRPIE